MAGAVRLSVLKLSWVDTNRARERAHALKEYQADQQLYGAGRKRTRPSAPKVRLHDRACKSVGHSHWRGFNVLTRAHARAGARA